MAEVRRQDTALSLPCLAEQFILQPCICPSTQSRKAICRVCLEEDSIVNLTQPCSCSGSMQHIHTDCLQSWISEKRSKSCEICWQEYQGSYRLPSPGQSAQPSSVQLIFPLQRPGVIVRVDQSTRTINFDYPPVSEYTDDARACKGSWCLTAVMGFIVMLLIQHLSGCF
ncbi:MAG: hypothetical protein FRX49_02618 [Trebouxia sp. A1-2]|nr:MAG: hypothetical protein FRX49_02618 [Trebouxia sp. A1-2]